MVSATIWILLSCHLVLSEWIEISQNGSATNESTFSNRDFKSYLTATTTSTTQLPITTKLTSKIEKGSQMPKIPRENDKVREDIFENGPPEMRNNGDGNGGFLSYLSSIQNMLLIRGANKNKISKIGVLKNLRDHLLYEIAQRIASLWQPKQEARTARDYKDMDFPSNEGALMTIGFLTFAVFLIKLVLHLIQVIGNKFENSNTTATAYLGRKRRSIITAEQIKILDMLDNFEYKEPEL